MVSVLVLFLCSAPSALGHQYFADPPVPRSKQHIVVCNGYADTRDVTVVEVPRGEHGSSTNFLRKQDNTFGRLFKTVGVNTESVAVGRNALWSRALAFKTCEEYYVDLATRNVVFESPHGKVCDLKANLAGRNIHSAINGPGLVAVVTQRAVGSEECRVRTLEPHSPADSQNHVGPPPLAQLLLLDAFTIDVEDSLINGEDSEDSRLPDLDRGAEVKLEDKVEPEVLATEIIATQTLGFDHSYEVDARTFLMALEELRGNHVLDQREIKLTPGRQYVVLRTGRMNDPDFPQELFIYDCHLTGEGLE